MARILVVDDDLVLQRMMEVILTHEGHSVVIAPNGYAALERLSREVFHLIISDANMPGGLNGFSLVSTIKHDVTLRHIPVIFLTGRDKKSDVVKARDAGVSEYLIKPLNRQLLTTKVAALLEAAARPKEILAGDVSASGVGEFHFRIINLTDEGVEILSPISMPVQFRVKITSELFQLMGIETPRLQVVSCSAFKDGDEAFRVSTAFYALSESDRLLVLAWLEKHTSAAGKTNAAS